MGESSPERKDHVSLGDLFAAIDRLAKPYERFQRELFRLERTFSSPTQVLLLQEAVTAIHERWQRIGQALEPNRKVLEAIDLSFAPVLQSMQNLNNIYGMGSRISSGDLAEIQSAIDDAKRDQEGRIAELEMKLQEKEKECETMRQQLKSIVDDVRKASEYIV